MTLLRTPAGKWNEAGPVLADLDRITREDAFREFAVTFSHAKAAAALPSRLKDPFDRLPIAQALAKGATLVTADRAFAACAVPVFWA